MDDYYDDDPLEEIESPVRSKKVKIFAGFALLAASAIFLRSTFAANISINSTPVTEFGQGFTALSSCAGSPVTLSIKPTSTFVNAANGGNHYLKTFRVDNVPATCQGVDFSFSTYDAAGSGANLMFDSNTILATVTTIYMSASNKFYPVNSGDLTVITNSASSFTASLDAPATPSNSVAKLTIQSTPHNSSAGMTWNSTGNVPASSSWNSITYGSGKFVAVGSNSAGNAGRAMYSTDGINWTLGSGVPATATSWSTVTYGNGIFVATSTNYIMYSSDGINWNSASTSLVGQIMNGGAYGNGRFVVSYYNGFVYSVDGSHWTVVSLGWTRSHIIFANGNFMALEFDPNLGVSSDGVNWSYLNDANVGNTSLGSLAYGNGTYVATSGAGVQHSVYSTNGGVSWSSISMPTEPYLGLVYGNGLFIGLGYDLSTYVPQGIYSNDAKSWTAFSSLPSGRWDSLTYGNGEFVAVAATGQAMYSN
jgi:hypothetical protein